jgi:uncharacterized membrane protein
MPTPLSSPTQAGATAAAAVSHKGHFRFHLPHVHLNSVFGNDWFALKAEAFARFFGTPVFLVVQTLIVLVWVSLNMVGIWKFDLYPFILLNLAFSLQSAYAAPLILLAQTRQADRDKAHADADALHREELSTQHTQALAQANEQAARLLVLVEQNTQLTAVTKELSQKIADLTAEIHRKMVPGE